MFGRYNGKIIYGNGNNQYELRAKVAAVMARSYVAMGEPEKAQAVFEQALQNVRKFYRIFKDEMGMTPTEYREAMVNSFSLFQL